MYLQLPLQDLAFIRGPALNRENTVIPNAIIVQTQNTASLIESDHIFFCFCFVKPKQRASLFLLFIEV